MPTKVGQVYRSSDVGCTVADNHKHAVDVLLLVHCGMRMSLMSTCYSL